MVTATKSISALVLVTLKVLAGDGSHTASYGEERHCRALAFH